MRRERGYILLAALMAAVLMSALAMIGVQILVNNARASKFEERQQRALQVAEAGVNYYLWHLAHNPTDYKDGGTTPASAPYGPFVHNYYDNDGNLIGTYELWITPPANGSTITTVKSIGKTPNMQGARVILAQLGQPSFSNYIFLSNTELNFSPTSTTTGPVHSNIGVQFDGTSNGPVTAARTTYTNGSGTHPGVWGAGGPQSQWQYPVPAIDFNSVTVNLSDMQTQASTAGVNLGTSGALGWYLDLKSNGTIDVYKVTSETTTGINKTFVRNQTAPGNGILFSPDELWISGTSWPGRISIVAAKLPDPGSSTNRRSINIVDNLTYAAKDGSAVVGLVAQQDIFLPRYVPNDLEVDAALLAQFGSMGYDTTNGGLKDTFSLYGGVAQNQNDYGLKVTGCGSYCRGFPTTQYTFDSHLIYAPPPKYPTTGNYSVLNWREQLYAP